MTKSHFLLSFMEKFTYYSLLFMVKSTFFPAKIHMIHMFHAKIRMFHGEPLICSASSPPFPGASCRPKTRRFCSAACGAPRRCCCAASRRLRRRTGSCRGCGKTRRAESRRFLGWEWLGLSWIAMGSSYPFKSWMSHRRAIWVSNDFLDEKQLFFCANFRHKIKW